MKKISYEFLKLFCKDDFWGFICEEPFLVEGELGKTWVATDMKVQLIVDKSKCMTDIYHKQKYKEGKVPDVYAVFDWKSKPTNAVTLEDLKKAVDSSPKVEEIIYKRIKTQYEECTACDGDGEISDEVYFRGRYYSYSCDCPVCGGYGKVPEDKDFDPDEDDAETFQSYTAFNTGKMVVNEDNCFRFNGNVYRYRVIDLLIKFMEYLGLTKIEYNFHKNGMIQFITPFSYFCAMPFVDSTLSATEVKNSIL